MQFSTFLVASVLGLAAAHPGGKPLEMSRRTLNHCKQQFAKHDFEQANVVRRAAEWRKIREERGLQNKPVVHRRDFQDVLAKDHESGRAVTPDTDDSELFSESGNCVLAPEVTEGPLYVRGEEIRKDVTEGEGGVALTLDIQLVDVNTCEPIPAIAVDLWSCNSTGVYGGVLDYPGNGDPNDLSLVNVTTLRGVQFTNEAGVVTFDTLVPGHYAGRTNHIHAMAHIGTTTQENGTITGGDISHVGQIYFDQSLLEAVEQTAPYATNNQEWTLNAVDNLMGSGAANNDDPVVNYVLIGDSVEDGLFGWMRMGIDPTASRQINPAAYIDEEGGHMSEGGWMPGGGFGGFGGFGKKGKEN